MDEGLLSLQWNNHHSAFLQVLSSIHRKDLYADVTLACDGKFYKSHKLVLSTCSEYFREMFHITQGKDPIIVLKDICSEDLECLLNYMYLGEVNVLQTKLPSLVRSAECLKIKGLASPDTDFYSPEQQNTKRRKPATDSRSSYKKMKSSNSRENSEPSTVTKLDFIDHTEDNKTNSTSSASNLTLECAKIEPSEVIDVDNIKEEVLQDDEEEYNASSLDVNKPQEKQSLNASSGSIWTSTEFTSSDAEIGDINFAYDTHLSNRPRDELTSNTNDIDIDCGGRSSPPNPPNASSCVGGRPSPPNPPNASSYVCSICLHRSMSRTDLTKHYRVHTGEKPYGCFFCHYRCSQSSNMRKHERNVHPLELSKLNKKD